MVPRRRHTPARAGRENPEMAEKKSCCGGKKGCKGKTTREKVALAMEEYVPKSVKAALENPGALPGKAARELADVQHTLAVAALDLSEKLQDRTEGLVKSLLAKKEGIPEELREAAGEWSRAACAGRKELKTAVDRTHKLLKAYLDKTEKAAAPAPKAKPAAKAAPKKAAAKKPAAKKPAAKKKAAPGKPGA